MATPLEILQEAIALNSTQKAELIDQLIRTLDKPDENIDKLWAAEVESRLAAYKQGVLGSVTLDEVLSKYK